MKYQKGDTRPLDAAGAKAANLPLEMQNWKPKQAPVIDINMNTKIPKNVSHRKNKNDFFRFLLT